MVLVFTGVTSFYSIKAMDARRFKDTADMAYKHLVITEKEVIQWLKQQPWRDSVIEANFPLFQAMRDIRNGYLTVKPFNVSVNYERRPAYGIWFHFEEHEQLADGNRPYTVIKTWKMPYAYISALKF